MRRHSTPAAPRRGGRSRSKSSRRTSTATTPSAADTAAAATINHRERALSPVRSIGRALSPLRRIQRPTTGSVGSGDPTKRAVETEERSNSSRTAATATTTISTGRRARKKTTAKKKKQQTRTGGSRGNNPDAGAPAVAVAGGDGDCDDDHHDDRPPLLTPLSNSSSADASSPHSHPSRRSRSRSGSHVLCSVDHGSVLTSYHVEITSDGTYCGRGGSSSTKIEPRLRQSESSTDVDFLEEYQVVPADLTASSSSFGGGGGGGDGGGGDGARAAAAPLDEDVNVEAWNRQNASAAAAAASANANAAVTSANKERSPSSSMMYRMASEVSANLTLQHHCLQSSMKDIGALFGPTTTTTTTSSAAAGRPPLPPTFEAADGGAPVLRCCDDDDGEGHGNDDDDDDDEKRGPADRAFSFKDMLTGFASQFNVGGGDNQRGERGGRSGPRSRRSYYDDIDLPGKHDDGPNRHRRKNAPRHHQFAANRHQYNHNYDGDYTTVVDDAASIPTHIDVPTTGGGHDDEYGGNDDDASGVTSFPDADDSTVGSASILSFVRAKKRLERFAAQTGRDPRDLFD